MNTIELIYQGVIYSKKNSKRIIKNPRTGKPQIISSKQAKDMESEMVKQFMAQAREKGWGPRISGETDANYVVNIGITEKDHNRRDLDNQATSILDALVSAMIIPDDSVKYTKALHVAYVGTDKNNPNAKIVVEEYKGGKDNVKLTKSRKSGGKGIKNTPPNKR